MRLESLIETGALPKEVVPLTDYARNCVTLSEFKKFPDDIKLSNTRSVICDNPQWVAIHKSSGQVISSDGNHIYKCVGQGKGLAQQTLTGSGKLATESYINLRTAKNKNEKETRNMEIGSNLNLDSLQKELETPKTGATHPMQSFNEEATVNPEDALVKNTISANLENIEQADASPLRQFNREVGEIVGYITNADAVIKFSAASKPVVAEDGKTKKLIPNAPGDVVAAHAQGNKVPSQYYQKESVLKARQAAPGAILGAVVGIPLGGLAPISELRGSGLVTPGSDKTLRYQVYDKETLYTILSLYFGGRIREAKKTHGEQSQYLNFSLKYGTKKNKEDGASIPVVKPQLKPDSRKSLLLPGNYFPIKVYKTIDVNKTLKKEEAELANLSAFVHLFTPVATREPKIRSLRAEDRAKLSKEGDVISSKFFTTDLNGREPLQIPAFYDKNKNIETISIPVKKKIEKQDGSGFIYRYDTINCLDAKQMANPEDKQLSSLYGPAYREFVEACNGAITVESLKSLTRSRGKSTKSGSDVVSAEQTRGLFLAQMERGLTNMQVEGVKRKPSFDEISEKIAQARG